MIAADSWAELEEKLRAAAQLRRGDLASKEPRVTSPHATETH